MDPEFWAEIFQKGVETFSDLLRSNLYFLDGIYEAAPYYPDKFDDGRGDFERGEPGFKNLTEHLKNINKNK